MPSLISCALLLLLLLLLLHVMLRCVMLCYVIFCRVAGFNMDPPEDMPGQWDEIRAESLADQ
jgi:hypothetical protein